MNWPDENTRKRVLNLWALAYGSPHPGETTNALTMLRRLQAELGLSDVELAFIAEYQQKEPMGSRIGLVSERPANAFEFVLHLFDMSHIVLTFPEMVLDSLWILHTYVFDQFLHTPRLLLRSAEPGCGKTTLLSFVNLLVNNGFKTDNTTPAALYYQLRDQPDTTLLIDEGENSALWARDPLLRAVLDAGHRYDGCFTRLIKGKPVRLSVFAPVGLALIPKKRVPSQLLSRSIINDMKKHPEGRDEIVPRDPKFAAVRGLICEWAPTFRRPQSCKIPFTGRLANNFLPLIEIAETLGYGATARAAALAIHRPSEDPVFRLFLDIRQTFEGGETGRIWTTELLDRLHQMENAHWDEFRGINGGEALHKLSRGELYELLETKGVTSKTVWKVVGTERKCGKGFLREQFEPVWRELFGDTPAQSSKIIRLPWHKKRHPDDTY